MSTSKFAAVVAVAILMVTSACGQNEAPSQIEDVEDIISMQARADGNFDVVCRDGRREVASAADIRANRVCRGGGDGQNGDLMCIARDNDGRDPWILGRMTSTGSIVRVSGPVFSTLIQCQQSLRSGVYIGSSTMICIARDNDGRAPWISAAIDGRGNLTRYSVAYETFNACTDALSSSTAIGSSLIGCVARDNDGRDPWILAVMSERGMIRVGGTVFSTVAQCRETLQSGRRTYDALLFCTSRDNDGRDPWIIASVREDGTFIRNAGTVFSTLSQCRSAFLEIDASEKGQHFIVRPFQRTSRFSNES